jgi:hypothetical protein
VSLLGRNFIVEFSKRFISRKTGFFLPHFTLTSGTPQAGYPHGKERHSSPQERLAIAAGHPRI